MKLKINEDNDRIKHLLTNLNSSLVITPLVISVDTQSFSFYMHNLDINFGHSISFTTEKFLDFIKQLEKEVEKYES
jgi:hypothetical protein